MWWTGIAVAATLRVALAMGLHLFLYPLLLLPNRVGRDAADRMAAACGTGLAVLVGGAHLLVSVKLFEGLGMFLFLLTLALVVLGYRGGAAGVRSTLERPVVTALSLLDRLGEEGWRGPWRERRPAAVAVAAPAGADANAALVTPAAAAGRGSATPTARRTLWALAAASLAVALYTRLTDALTQAAPASSDYVVHLQWVNWLLDPNMGLFPGFDWVYPKGMNAVVGALHLISRESTHVTLRTAGPLFSLLTAAGIWYVVRAATRSEAGALLSAALFAGAPAWLPAVWERQSTALPQEFAMALLLPGAWWAFRYLVEGDPLDGFLVSATVLVVAASHWGVLVYLAAAMAAAVLASASHRGMVRRTVWLALWAGAGLVLGLAPQAVALASGVPLHQASVTFALDLAQGPQALTAGVLVLAALTGAAGLAGSLAPATPRQGYGPGFLTAVLGGFLLMHYLPVLGLRSQALVARSTDFVSLALVAAVGVAFGALERWAGPRWGHGRTAAGALLVAAGVWLASPPAPLRMEPQLTSEYALEVMRLTRELTPGSWIAVGRSTLLAMVQGYAGQVDGEAFVRRVEVPPSKGSMHRSLADAGLTDWAGKPENDPALYLFVELDPFVPADQSADTGARIRAEAAELARWAEAYTRLHGAPEIRHRSPGLIIYGIAPPAGR